jgi:hypothetical protein
MDGIQAKYPNQGLPLGSIHPHESEKEVIMQARMDLRKCVWVLAVVLGSGVVGGSLRAAPSPRSQEHAQEQDYSKNKNYQAGMRDGKDDKAHKRDHSRNRKFKKDEDQKAYEAGYQQAHR